MIEGEHYLYVDVECTDCGKLMALSYAYRHENKYLCEPCAMPYIEELEHKYWMERLDDKTNIR